MQALPLDHTERKKQAQARIESGASMLKFQVKTTAIQAGKGVDELIAKQIPFATSLTLNRVAQFSKDTLYTTMGRVFDRPKPYTLNSLFVKNSTKSNLTALVGHKKGSPVNSYLQPEIEGGGRGLKGLERLFTRGASEFLVPGGGMRLDSYGNASRAQLKQIIAAQRKADGKDRKGIFIVYPGSKSHLKPGVYQRMGLTTKITRSKGKAVRAEKRTGGLKALMVFTTRATYRPIYDMQGVVTRVVEAEFGKQFTAQLDHALSTAKPPGT